MKPCKRAAITMKLREFVCFSPACKLSYRYCRCYVVCFYCGFPRCSRDTYINCFAICHGIIADGKTLRQPMKSTGVFSLCLSRPGNLCVHRKRKRAHTLIDYHCVFFISLHFNALIVVISTIAALMFAFCSF